MNPEDVDFDLPVALIAAHPTPIRSDSRLLAVADQDLAITTMKQLPACLRAGDLLVFNDTRVIPARLFGQKDSGGKVEILLERVTGTETALAQVKASHAPKPGSRLSILTPSGAKVATARVDGRDGRFFMLAFDQPVSAVTEAAGHMPLPPYIERADSTADRERYQTTYARHPGAVAAPTAGLHFDDALFAELADAEIAHTFVTLHVAAGTFAPLSADQLERGELHAEHYDINADCCAAVGAARARGGRVIAVGTTSLRALESAALLHDAVAPLQPTTADTTLFIRPGFEFRVVDGLVTNFHLPRSSLLMLVAAFTGRRRLLGAYQHAVTNEMRFFSYGDAMLCWRQEHDLAV